MAAMAAVAGDGKVAPVAEAAGCGGYRPDWACRCASLWNSFTRSRGSEVACGQQQTQC